MTEIVALALVVLSIVVAIVTFVVTGHRQQQSHRAQVVQRQRELRQRGA